MQLSTANTAYYIALKKLKYLIAASAKEVGLKWWCINKCIQHGAATHASVKPMGGGNVQHIDNAGIVTQSDCNCAQDVFKNTITTMRSRCKAGTPKEVALFGESHFIQQFCLVKEMRVQVSNGEWHRVSFTDQWHPSNKELKGLLYARKTLKNWDESRLCFDPGWDGPNNYYKLHI